jgi:hypothetical protein
MLARILAALILGPLASTAAHAQTSEEYAVMGGRAWHAFQCSTLVDKTERPDERQRLFNLGYKQGKAFIEAWQSGKVEWKDVSRHVPIDVLDTLDPWVNPRLPTTDFRLGAVWAGVWRDTVALIEKSGDPELSAKLEYDRRGCGLLLR